MYFQSQKKASTIRYFYALVSFLFKNAWVSVQRKHFMRVKRGPQTIESDSFRFDMFIHFIGEWVRRKLKVRSTVEC